MKIALLKISLLMLIMLWLLSFLAKTMHHDKIFFPTRGNLQTNVNYQVKQVKVIEGHVFDVILKNNLRYKIYLNKATTPFEAKSEVVKILNNSKEMTIIPVTWKSDHWDVEIQVDGKSLKDLLKEKGLIFDNK